MIQSFSPVSVSIRAIGRALKRLLSASVTSQQYRMPAIVFAAPAKRRLT
jgi:hypothetical protein